MPVAPPSVPQIPGFFFILYVKPEGNKIRNLSSKLYKGGCIEIGAKTRNRAFAELYIGMVLKNSDNHNEKL
jgi:hypothetical protein